MASVWLLLTLPGGRRPARALEFGGPRVRVQFGASRSVALWVARFRPAAHQEKRRRETEGLVADREGEFPGGEI